MNNQTKQANSYSSEFKESAVKLALESDQSIAQIARDLGGKQHPAYLDQQICKTQDKYRKEPTNIFMIKKTSNERISQSYSGERLAKKGHRILCQGNRVKYAWIKEPKTNRGK